MHAISAEYRSGTYARRWRFRGPLVFPNVTERVTALCVRGRANGRPIVPTNPWCQNGWVQYSTGRLLPRLTISSCGERGAVSYSTGMMRFAGWGLSFTYSCYSFHSPAFDAGAVDCIKICPNR
jgi:hypothetical protein